jgi:RNA polymerase sigma-70 factor (ECF subfamily)
LDDAGVLVKRNLAGGREDRSAGTADACAQAVAGHQSLVFSVAYHLLHSVALAEEIAQEVFLRLHRDLCRIQGPSHLVHWLRRTTTHRCLDVLRRQAGRRQVPLEEADLPAPQVAERDPLLGRTLRRLVAELPPTARAVVVLRYQEDLDPREIAQVLDLPVNTVKSRLHRALAALRGRLTELEESSHATTRE